LFGTKPVAPEFRFASLRAYSFGPAGLVTPPIREASKSSCVSLIFSACHAVSLGEGGVFHLPSSINARL